MTPTTFHIGEIEIAAVSDGIVYVDAGGPFGLVPRALYSRYLAPNADNLIPMALTCLLVRAAGKTILVDTALGDKLTEKDKRNWNLVRRTGGLLADLARHGVTPDDVDIVINTHLHGDHVSGNTTWADSSATNVRPVFPNAQYIVQRGEYEQAMRPNERTRATYFPINYASLVASGQMLLQDADAVDVVAGVKTIVTAGHTPRHTSVTFTSQSQAGLFVADLAMYTAHFERLGWMSAYDIEPMVTLESKRYWQQWALDQDALLIFQHDPYTITGKLVADGDKRLVEPILHQPESLTQG